jgi:hypothetical protein
MTLFDRLPAGELSPRAWLTEVAGLLEARS